MKKTLVVTSVLAALAISPALAFSRSEDVPLIPRAKLFGNPDRANAQISPDGQRLAFLAPKDGVLNVWVAPLRDLEAAEVITQDKYRGVRNYNWCYDNQHLVYLQDQGGDENFHVYSVDLETGKTIDLTPHEGIAAQIAQVSARFPGEILIGINNRSPQFHDLYRIDVATGEATLLLENPGVLEDGMTAGWVTDDHFAVRMVMTVTQSGGARLFQRSGESWERFSDIPQEDLLTTSPSGFDAKGNLYLQDSRGRNTSALYKIDLASNEKSLIAESAKADVSDLMLHPTEKTIQAVAFTHRRKEWTILDDAIAADLKTLREVANGDIEITSRTLDDQHWIATYLMDDGPVRYYHYDRAKQKARFLFTNRSDLEGLPLAKMHDVVVEARDGLELVCYLTLPKGTEGEERAIPTSPQPMVLFVHGGPWARDSWGYHPYHQLYANRGYAVLSVNYRGSTGFGKEFVNASNGEWAGKMHDDLIDAVNWAVEKGIAQKEKVAIMGGSYGGYATLVGMTFTPDVFAAGVDIVGPSSLVTLMESFPAYWGPAIDVWKTRVGDFTTEEGKKFLLSRSPITRVNDIKKPLLIGQGANDPRVTQIESDRIVGAMQEKKIPVTYALFPDEGHGFRRPENNTAFSAVSEAFLSQHLGGRVEPIKADFQGSTIEFPAGAELVPGVVEALAKNKN